MKNVALLRLRHGRARRARRLRRGAVRQRRGRLLDRRAAREGEDVHQRRRSRPGEPFFLYLAFKAPHLPQIPAPRHEGMFAEHPAVAAAELQRGRRLRQADAGCRRCALAELGRARPDPHRPARDAAGGRRGDRRQHRRSASPASWSTSANLGIADDTIVVFFADNGWLLGRASPAREEQALRGVDPLADVRPLSEARAAAARRDALRAQHRPGADLRRARRRRRPDRARRREPACACSTARSAGLAHRLPRRGAGRAATRGRSCARRSGSTPRSRSTPGNPADDLRARALRPRRRSVRGDERRDAIRSTRRASRRWRRGCAQLRPNWPVDSDPNGPDPAEDPDDD